MTISKPLDAHFQQIVDTYVTSFRFVIALALRSTAVLMCCRFASKFKKMLLPLIFLTIFRSLYRLDNLKISVLFFKLLLIELGGQNSSSCLQCFLVFMDA